jgi:hypothetical protein
LAHWAAAGVLRLEHCVKKKTHILANKSYGLYYASIVEYDPASGIAQVEGCRHIARWFGKTGGITSLAAYGLCGPRAGDSRIGAPCIATLTGIVNTFECSPEAARTFDHAEVQDG